MSHHISVGSAKRLVMGANKSSTSTYASVVRGLKSHASANGSVTTTAEPQSQPSVATSAQPQFKPPLTADTTAQPIAPTTTRSQSRPSAATTSRPQSRPSAASTIRPQSRRPTAPYQSRPSAATAVQSQPQPSVASTKQHQSQPTAASTALPQSQLNFHQETKDHEIYSESVTDDQCQSQTSDSSRLLIRDRSSSEIRSNSYATDSVGKTSLYSTTSRHSTSEEQCKSSQQSGEESSSPKSKKIKRAPSSDTVSNTGNSKGSVLKTDKTSDNTSRPTKIPRDTSFSKSKSSQPKHKLGSFDIKTK